MSAPIEHTGHPQWLAVAQALAALPQAEGIIVFGSVAKGAAGSDSDIDCLMPSDDPRGLAIARRHYGAFDPFCEYDGTLLCRNRPATAWTPAKNWRSIRRAIKRDDVPLPEIMKRITT